MKKQFKIYGKEYEDVFSGERTLKSIQWEKVSNDLGLTNLQYIDQYRDFMREMYLTIFDLTVKFFWMNVHFNYNKRGRGITGREKPFWFRIRLAVMARNFIGIDFKPITQSFFTNKISTYFKDFFPKFVDKNPFTESEYYKFPFQHVTPDFLLVVYQMPERLKLLEIAEEQKMTFGQFLDYVINYTLCYNDEHGKEIYTFMNVAKTCPYYVRYNKGSKISRTNAKKHIGKN